MIRRSRIILIAVVTLLALTCVAWLGVGIGLPSYDQHARAHVLELVAAEVPIASKTGVMEAFMRKHAAEYSVDDRFNHQFGGVLPQSRLDRILGNRKVIIALRFDSNRTFTGAEVLVTYQTL